MTAQPLLEVSNLSVTFPSEAGPVAAVRSLSYHICLLYTSPSPRDS